MILRPGYVTQKMLEEVANQVDVDKTILDANCHLRPKAPGMRYRHYAPKGDLTIIEGAQDAVKEAICEKSRQATADGHRVGIIATDETMEAYRQNSNAASIKSVGTKGKSGQPRIAGLHAGFQPQFAVHGFKNIRVVGKSKDEAQQTLDTASG